MLRQLAFIVLAACFWGQTLPPAGAQEAPKGKAKEKQPSKAKAEAASLTGCIDQQDGKYVLVNDRTRSPVAALQADGFPTEGFAKHVGHRVTVRGASGSASEGALPLFRVRSVETLSESCEPQQSQQK